MLAMMLLPTLMAASGGGYRSVAVLDATGSRFGERVVQVLNEPAIPVTATRVEVLVAVRVAVAAGDSVGDGDTVRVCV